MQNTRARTAYLAALVVLGAMGLCTSGCDSSDSGSNASSFVVQYLAAAEFLADGSAVIDRVIYYDETGPQTVDLDPAEEGWSQSVLLIPGDSFFLRAEGTVTSGRIRLQVVAQGDDGSTLNRRNDQMPFTDGQVFIEIAEEILP